MKSPIISIIVPNYNNEKYIEETLNSVLNQKSPNWECIIVDDGSTDSSPEIARAFVKKDKRFKYIERSRLPKNANTCRNIGAVNSKGDYLMFLDSDDKLLPNCIKSRIDNLRNETDLLIHGTMILREDGSTYFPYPLLKDQSYLKNFLRYNLLWHTSSVTWSKLFFNSIGGFNESYQRLQDIEMHVRALNYSNINVNYKVENKDSLYRKIVNREDYKSEEFYKKMLNSHIKYLSYVTNEFKKSDFRKDILIGVSHLMSNLIHANRYFNFNQIDLFKVIDILNTQMIINEKGLLLLKRIIEFNKASPLLINDKLHRLILRTMIKIIMLKNMNTYKE